MQRVHLFKTLKLIYYRSFYDNDNACGWDGTKNVNTNFFECLIPVVIYQFIIAHENYKYEIL